MLGKQRLDGVSPIYLVFIKLQAELGDHGISGAKDSQQSSEATGLRPRVADAFDLLLDRADRTINLIEIKFSQGPFTITKSYASELRRKVQVFKEVTKTEKNVYLTFLTSHGLTKNAYQNELVDTSITTECLFQEIL